MNNTYASMIFLGVSGVLLIVGVILWFTKDRVKDKAPKLDEHYPEKLRTAYFETGFVEETFVRLADDYADDKYMMSLIEKSMGYLNGDYGDYETALDMMNINDDEEVKKVNDTILSADMAKRMALPLR